MLLSVSSFIWGLFYYINKIVYHPEKQSLKPLWVTNGILIGLIVCVSVAWLFGAVEWRNEYVNNHIAEETSSVQTNANIFPEQQTIPTETTETSGRFQAVFSETTFLEPVAVVTTE